MFSLNMLDSSMFSLLLSTFFCAEQIEGSYWVTFTLWVLLLETSFMLKSYGWWVDFRDSPESKFLFPFSIWLWAWDLDLGLSISFIAINSFSLLLILFGLEDKESQKCSEVDQKTLKHIIFTLEMIWEDIGKVGKTLSLTDISKDWVEMI